MKSLTSSKITSGEFPTGGGGGDDMERRLSAVEARLEKLAERSHASELQLAVLNERVSHLPSKGFIVTVVVLGFGLVAGMTALQGNVGTLVNGPQAASITPNQ